LNKERAAVIKPGVELHELRTDAAAKPDWEIPPQVARYLGLHAKFYVIDNQRVFLGSVNLDPRSKYVNTEMGVLIESPRLAGDTAAAIARFMTLDNAWRVEIGPGDRLQWRNDTETLHRQPARNIGQRVADLVFGWLPIRNCI
jgi:putative cardiolipin synthase